MTWFHNGHGATVVHVNTDTSLAILIHEMIERHDLFSDQRQADMRRDIRDLINEKYPASRGDRE